MSVATLVPEIARIIRDATTLREGANDLYALARKHVPATLPVWKIVDAIRWEDDVDVVRAAWEKRLRSCVPKNTTGIYLGIDGLNMPAGKGIELGCSREFKPGSDDIDFIFGCEVYCKDLPSPGLKQYYDWHYGANGHETYGKRDALYVEFPVCLGASALVFREVFSTTDPSLQTGDASERCFAYGFHDGDILRLGRATSDGFTCEAVF